MHLGPPIQRVRATQTFPKRTGRETKTNTFENGMAPSREKAQKTRPVLSWELITQGPRAMKRMNSRPNAPPVLSVTWRNSSASGIPVLPVVRESKSWMENIRVMRYVMPVQKAIDRVIAMARGALREGCGHQSIVSSGGSPRPNSRWAFPQLCA